MSYSELASMIPVSGSAYTYAYATMGEVNIIFQIIFPVFCGIFIYILNFSVFSYQFVAWILGWDLILEYMVGAATGK